MRRTRAGGPWGPRWQSPPCHRMGKTDRPLYFRSFDAALRPLDTAAAASRWGWWTEGALRMLETPWPWDTSCTSMGVCPAGAACAETTGFAIICDEGIVRDAVEPRLDALAAWAGQAGHPQSLIMVALATIVGVQLLLACCTGCGREESDGKGGGEELAARRQQRTALRRARRRRLVADGSSGSGGSSSGSGSGSGSSSGSGDDESESSCGGEVEEEQGT